MQRLWMTVIIAMISSGVLPVKAAELLSLRAGEDAHYNRLVLVTDQQYTWHVQLIKQQLRIHAQGVSAHLPATIALPQSSAIAAAQLKHQGNSLIIEANLTRPMQLKAHYALAHKKGDKARYVIELVNDQSQKKVSAQQVVQSVSHEIQVQKNKTALHQSTAKNAIDTAADIKTLATPVLSIKPFKGTRALIVAIDPGHGGKDVGAISASGKLEKELTLSVAKALKQQIDALPNMRAVLTRDGDYFVPLSQRPQIARELNADVFISLHADSYKDHKIAGASFYVTSNRGASSQLAKFVAAHSNSAERLSDGVETWSQQQANQIGRVALNSSIDDSYQLARRLQQGFKQAGIRLQHSQVQSANFMVLKNFDMPSVLVEMGFISNPAQDHLLHQTHYQQQLAASLLHGLVKFVEVQPEPGVVYANIRVMKGDSLAKLAQRHSTSVAYLAKANNLNEKSPLKIGQVLKVPVNMTQRVAMLRDTKG